MIRFEQVEKRYPKQLGATEQRAALSGISFHMQAGEALGLIGPNGAGKSTCIHLLMDFIRPTRGRVRLFEEDPVRAEVRQQIGYLPEAASLPDHLSCQEILRFAGRSCQMPSESIAEASKMWLKRLNLWEDRNRLLRTYSKGMLQRTSFAMALIHDPELLILDEPMSGLDPMGRADIVALIRELKDRGKTILFCSHLLEDVEQLVDRIIVLHQGHVLFSGDSGNMLPGEGNMKERFISLIGGST